MVIDAAIPMMTRITEMNAMYWPMSSRFLRGDLFDVGLLCGHVGGALSGCLLHCSN